MNSIYYNKERSIFKVFQNFSKLTAFFVLWSAPQDSARLLTHACIELKNKQTEVIHENSEDLNQKNWCFGARVRKRAPSWGWTLYLVDSVIWLIQLHQRLLINHYRRMKRNNDKKTMLSNIWKFNIFFVDNTTNFYFCFIRLYEWGYFRLWQTY